MIRLTRLAGATATALAFSSPSHRGAHVPSRSAVSCAAAPPTRPPIVHATLSAATLRAKYGCDLERGGRVIVVGDVHGCCDELQDLLTEVDWQQGRWAPLLKPGL